LIIGINILAAGHDGKGALPEDFWPTYSAFANTNGGTVVLGVREKDAHFIVEGVADVAKVRTGLFNSLNKQKRQRGDALLRFLRHS
jgi:predicted HTH transcriptional regulator